ncbi:hypothetical protein A4H02_07120 [Fervidobacterium thailandense]|uniref:Uncharacterized protein n=1 Tax=Fervidobacterium thailandense TaxID=1008305 RepID=A0A1E3G1P8_9BACT|nr:hypothetical protein A4H02_07120 [Fervidobacterium thailandense]
MGKSGGRQEKFSPVPRSVADEVLEGSIPSVFAFFGEETTGDFSEPAVVCHAFAALSPFIAGSVSARTILEISLERRTSL